MATYLIGDIQGCYEPLQRLLEKIRFDPACDQLWPLGDLVNRGGQSLEVLQLLVQLGPGCSVTLGNHDLYLLASDFRHPDGRCKNPELARVLHSADRHKLIRWLSTQPLAAWSEEHQLLRVHAGVVPQWTAKQTLRLAAEVSAVLGSPDKGIFLKRMYGNSPNKWTDKRKGWSRLRLITNILTRIRVCTPEGKVDFKFTGSPGSQQAGYRPWYRHRHRRTREVVVAVGHWAALGLRMKTRYMALDTGCVWGGQLTAVRLEDRAVFQVPGQRARKPAWSSGGL